MLGALFLLLALALGLTAPWPSGGQWLALALLVPLYLVAQRTEFVHGASGSVPTQAVFVGMMLMVPPQVVPLAIVAILTLDNLLHARTVADWFITWFTGCYCLGPVLVLTLVHPGPLGADTWWIYLLALLSQFLVDLLANVAAEILMGRRPETVLRPMIWSQGVDACLSVIGASAVLAVGGSLWAVLLIAAPVALIALFVQDRQVLATDRESLDQEVTAVRTEARIDALTGLSNRRAWQECLDEADRRLAVGTIARVGVIMADLNDLKLVNDSFGHDVGDELLRTVGRLFAATAPDEACAARFGGDEFGIIVFDPEPGEINDVIERLHATLSAHPGINGLTMSASIGGAVHPPQPTVAAAIQAADAAAIAAKERYRQGRHRHDPRLPGPRTPLQNAGPVAVPHD